MSEQKYFKNSSQNDETFMVPPQNLEAEKAILAGILSDNDVMNICSEYLVDEDFYKEAHQQIFKGMIALNAKSEPVDLVTLNAYLDSKKVLERIGGTVYLTELVENTPLAANVESYCKLIAEKAILRKLIHTSGEIVTDCHNLEELSVADIVDKAESKLFAISENKSKKSFTPVKNLVVDSYKLIEKLYENKDQITGVTTGFPHLDDMTGGLQRGDLIIVAGRPSMGKTAFSLNVAQNAAKAGHVVGVFSLEMSKESLVMRMMTCEAKIDAGRVRKGELYDEDWPKLSEAAEDLSQMKVFIDDQGGQTTFELRAKCRRLKKEHGLDMVLVDYLQLLRSANKTQSREQEISEISRNLKALAKEMNVPVIALSQLNRSLESRQDKRPVMSDLRESGAIEQDADVIAFIYRDVVYNPETPDQNTAEIIIGKQRNGPTGTSKLAFLKQYTKFEPLAYDESSDEEFFDNGQMPEPPEGFAGPAPEDVAF